MRTWRWLTLPLLSSTWAMRRSLPSACSSSAATGTVRTLLACPATKNTWVVISAIRALSGLSTSSNTVYSTTLLLAPLPLELFGLPPPWLDWSRGFGGTGRICRTLLVQRRLPPARVVK
ncbi:hypothetical protein D9M71_683450 [compost metagenome]